MTDIETSADDTLSDAQVIEEALGPFAPGLKKALIRRHRRERCLTIARRLAPLLIVAGIVTWLTIVAIEKSKHHVIDMSGAKVSLAEFPESTSVESSPSHIRLTTAEAAFVDLGEFPAKDGVIRAELSLGDAAKCGIVLRRFETEGTESILAVTVRRSMSQTSPEVCLDVSVHSFKPVETGRHSYARRILGSVPIGTLNDDEFVPVAISIGVREVAVSLKGEPVLTQVVGELTSQFHARNLRNHIGIFAHSGSGELRNLEFTTP